MNQFEERAKIFKALCDSNRIAIIELLKSGELCACTIGEELGLAQSKLSYHMKILVGSGILKSWNVGKWTHYEIDKLGCDIAVETLLDIVRIKGE